MTNQQKTLTLKPGLEGVARMKVEAYEREIGLKAAPVTPLSRTTPVEAKPSRLAAPSRAAVGNGARNSA